MFTQGLEQQLEYLEVLQEQGYTGQVCILCYIPDCTCKANVKWALPLVIDRLRAKLNFPLVGVE